MLTPFLVGARLDQLSWSGEETAFLDALSYLSPILFKSAILAPQQAKDKQMKNLTTPQAILCGFALVALAIASIPYSSNIVSPAQAYTDRVQKVAICNLKPNVTPRYQTKDEGYTCADVATLASPHGKIHDVHMLITSDHYLYQEKALKLYEEELRKR